MRGFLPTSSRVGEEGARRGPRAPQAQEIRGTSAWVLSTERVDAVALRLGPMVTRGGPEVLDRPRPRHGTPRGRRWGWTAGRWLASRLTAGDHRHVSGDTARTGRPHTRSHRTAQGIAPREVRDDRWSPRRPHGRTPAEGPQRAHDVQARSRAVDDVPQDVSRGEAPTVSGAPAVSAAGRCPGGPRQEAPPRPQSTVMRGSLDPVGRPLSTEVWAGARAAAGVSIPRRERLRTGVKPTGLGWVGAGPLRARATRASLVRPQDGYGSPGPVTGAPAPALDAWLTAGVTPGEAGACARRGRPKDRGPEGRAAAGEACERTGGAPGGAGAWSDRVVVGRAPRPAHPQAAGLATRRRQAAPPRTALTPPRGRGTRPSTAAARRVEARDRVRPAPRVDGGRRVAWEQPVEPTTRDGGRGRGAWPRETRVRPQPRDHLPHRTRPEARLAARPPRVGWQAWATQAGHTRLSGPEAVWGERQADRGARLGHRLKRRVPIAPLGGPRHAPLEGLTYLLTRGGRG